MTEPRPRTRRAKPAEPAAAPAKPAGARAKTPSKPRQPAKPPSPRTAKGTPPAPALERSSGPRRVWLSGATGFVGKAVIRVLRTRGDEVVAPVRDLRKANDLIDMGVTVIEDDLSEVASLTEMLRGVDAAIHAAGSYRVGIAREERGAMWDANIGTTTRVLDAAEAARTPRIVYVSTVGVFGNTRGVIVDESFRRDIGEGFLSWYDETKFGAHEVALQRARAGAPIVTVQPSQVYGPGDHTNVGEQLALAHAGKLPYRALEDAGVGWVHVDDLAVGIVAALDRGAVGRAYVLSGPTHRVGEALAIAARLGGKRLPRLAIPNAVLRVMARVGRLSRGANLRELVSASAGVTYWASNARAAEELGWHPRDLETGLRDTFAFEALD